MNKRKILIAIMAIMMLFTASACHMVFANDEKDLAQVVAVVNGKEITKGDVLAVYNTYRYEYDLTSENQNTDTYRSKHETLMNESYELLIEYYLMEAYGSEYGDMTLTDSMKADIASRKETTMNSLRTIIESNVKEEAEKDPSINVEAEIESRVAELFDYRGYTSGEYDKRLGMEAQMTVIEEGIKSSYTPTEKALQDYYDKELEAQKEYIGQDISYAEYYNNYGTLLYVPDGLRYVKNLLIKIPDDKYDEITQLRADGDEAGADRLRDEELAKIQGKTDDVNDKILAGEDYAELLKTYGEDPGMAEGAKNAETGYIIYEGMTSFDIKFVDGALALKNPGDVSAPIASDYGYYIIQYVSDSKAHDVPLEDVRTEMEKGLTDSKSTELYEEVLENWKRSADIVEYKERLFK
ncbi:MAG: peptidylprolyl isomerase [Christensenellaceae bacterium]|jgi:hypothetical protein